MGFYYLNKPRQNQHQYYFLFLNILTLPSDTDATSDPFSSKATIKNIVLFFIFPSLIKKFFNTGFKFLKNNSLSFFVKKYHLSNIIIRTA
jgi:hypothetical protein